MKNQSSATDTTPIFSQTLNRREMLRYASLGALGFLASSALVSTVRAAMAHSDQFKGEDVFNSIVAKAAADNWKALPIGQLIGKVAMELKGTPYVGFTLEVNPDAEYCVINLKGLDCVTFFEDSLCMARMLKKGGSTPEALISEVQFTRYRDGKVGDFTSRLHYTTDWMVNNQKKGVVRILAPELPGAEPFTQKVGIMSERPNNYRQLKAHPDMVPVIHQMEETINGYSLKYVPNDKLAGAEPLLQTGDIVGVCTTEAGIDIAHTGLCIKDEQGKAHFMDASSSRKNMKVTLETGLAGHFNWSPKLTGAMFARPLEVAKV